MVLALPLVKPTEKVYVRIKNTREEEQLLTARILLGTMKECYLPEKCAATQTVRQSRKKAGSAENQALTGR